MSRPVLALSLGCPSGVGPEVAVAAAAKSPEACCVLVGDEAVIRRAAAIRRIAMRRIIVVDDPHALHALAPGVIGIWSGSTRLPALPAFGHPDAAAGAAQLAWIDEATDLVRARVAAALVTGPVSKHAVATSGAPGSARFRGHTEHLAERLGAPEVVMAFASKELTTALVTTHLALAAVPDAITPEAVATSTYWQRLDDAVRTRLIAQANFDRAVADRNSTIVALDAARQQIFTAPGVGGAGYAQQKQDEVEIRRLELTYQRSVARDEAAGLQHDIDAETDHVVALREVAVSASVGGVISAVYVSAGTELVRGNPLADVMDCAALYIEATVSTGWFATPRPGDQVRVGLYGVSGTMVGRIRSLRDTAMALDPSRSIPLSERQSRQTVTAIIDIDRADILLSRDHGCPVGQPASVQFK